jgi:hypothetical protein
MAFSGIFRVAGRQAGWLADEIPRTAAAAGLFVPRHECRCAARGDHPLLLLLVLLLLVLLLAGLIYLEGSIIIMWTSVLRTLQVCCCLCVATATYGVGRRGIRAGKKKQLLLLHGLLHV